jgi:carbonic anhydrase
VNDLIERFRALGVDRFKLPDNLVEFFGLFASERQNVIKAVTFVRQSSLIGPRIPVHGLLVDVQTGQLEWIVNGYQVLETALARTVPPPGAAQTLGALAVADSDATTPIAPPSQPEATSASSESAGHAPAEARQWLGHVRVVSEDSPAVERPVTAAQGNPPVTPGLPPLLRGLRARRPPQQS